MNISIKKKSVLLVEDNPGDVRLIQEVLKSSPFPIELVVANDGQRALDLLDSLRPDIILLDINLPKVDGHTVLKTVKARPKLRRIPVIILSTSESESDVNGAYDAYANCYIAKPLDFELFMRIVQDIQQHWLGPNIIGPTQLN